MQQQFGQSAVRHPADMTDPFKPLASQLRVNIKRFTLQDVLVCDVVSH